MMEYFRIEVKKTKRTGILLLLPVVGIAGGIYALFYVAIRREALLNLPMAPTDALLTQLYGMMMLLNLLAVVTAACLLYNIEYTGQAIRKMYMLPVKITTMYLCKFLILALLLLVALGIQMVAMGVIGVTALPEGTFETERLIGFALYAFLTALPVLSFMLMSAAHFRNLWTALGTGVVGFLSGMALATLQTAAVNSHPFVVMMKPAVTMQARPDLGVITFSLTETMLFLLMGLWLVKNQYD